MKVFSGLEKADALEEYMIFLELVRRGYSVDGNAKQWTDENGIVYIGVIPFLLEES